MKFGEEGIPVNIYPAVEADGNDAVVWYGFICGTPEFTVAEAKRYLTESEQQLPSTDPRVVVTGIDEVQVFHVTHRTPISMVRQALHSNRHKPGLRKSDGVVLPREDGDREFLGLTQISEDERPLETVQEELAQYVPFIQEAVGEGRRIATVDLYMSVDPASNRMQILWRFGVEGS